VAAERSMLTFALLLATACPGDDSDTDSTQTLAPESMTSSPNEDSSSTSSDPTTDPSTDPTTTSSTTAPSEDSSSSGGGADGCNAANQCEAGYCVAPYADNDRGDFVCVPDCVVPGDESSWCFDAAACCDADATCTERGYCVLPDDTTSGG
jgi:hypothetical protein